MSRRFVRLSVTTMLVSTSFSATLVAQSRFEGVVTMRIGAAQASEVTYSAKGDKVRVDMSGMGGMSVYVLRDPTATLLVLPAQQMYMDQTAMPGMPAAPAAAARKTSIKMTGKKETIAGYECEHIIVTDETDGAQTDVCGAKGLGTFSMPGSPMGGMRGRGAQASSAWEHIGEFFPLKVQKVGGEVSLEVTKIEKKSLDDATFKLPDGFTKMDMGAMGRMGRPPR